MHFTSRNCSTDNSAAKRLRSTGLIVTDLAIVHLCKGDFTTPIRGAEKGPGFWVANNSSGMALLA